MNKDLFILDGDFLTTQEVLDVERDTHHTFFQLSKQTGSANDGIGGVAGKEYTDFAFFVSNPDIPGNERIHDVCMFVLNKFCHKHGLEVDEVFRSRSNIAIRNPDRRPSRPHVDTLDHEHYVFLYYVDSADGDTILYDQHADGSFYTPEDLTIFKSITPTAGTAVLFPGRQFHAWSAPGDSEVRTILNMNVTFKG